MNNVIFLNHRQKACGVYQYGYRSGKILQKSKVYNFIYVEVESEAEFVNTVNVHNPIGIIYNYHPATMPWLSSQAIKNRYPNIIHYMLYHEGDVNNSLDYVLYVDSTHQDIGKSFSIPRPLLANNFSFSENEIPIISSFGFGFEHKGFEKIVKLVNEQFDEAIIRLHIPYAFYADRDGHRSKAIANRCFQEIKNSNIQLIITNNFLTDEELLSFLAASTINIFLYDNFIGGFSRGLSSVIDYALSVKVPLAISKSNMFRHIINNSPSICVEDRSISEIIKDGNTIIQTYRDKWSNENFNSKYELIISNTTKL
jgi:hypothetical protein